MKTIEIKLYQFNELSEEAKKNALQECSSINIHFDWWDCILDDLKEDGVELSSFDIYRQEIDIRLDFALEDVCALIIDQRGSRSAIRKLALATLDDIKKTQKTYENSFDEWGECSDYDEEMQDLEVEFIGSLQGEVLSLLGREYDYQTSEEAIIETIEANEYDFTENGERYKL